MASPSSGSTSPPTLADRQPEIGDASEATAEAGRSSRSDLVLVAGLRNAVAADFATFVCRSPRGEAVLVADPRIRALAGAGPRSLSPEECSRSTRDVWGGPEPTSLVFFLPSRLTEADRRDLEGLAKAASRWPIRFVGIVSSFRVHLEDTAAEEAERLAISLVRAGGFDGRVAIFRPAHILGPRSGPGRWLDRLGPLFPLAPEGLRSCFVEAEEVFAAIEAERSERSGEDGPAGAGRALGRHERAYTFLGANLSWREILSRHRGASPVRRVATAVASVLSRLLLGHLIGLAVALLARATSWAKPWSVGTLKPRSMGELLSLCHRGNIDRVRVVGYNNGVNHFGHRHHGKTVVSTVRLHRAVHAGPGMLKVDAGATIRAARDYLGGLGEELFVVPNYSYVAIGTAYFVPIHGSAVDYSTVADTACRVVLYDPDRDRIVSAGRDDEAFRENLYNPRSRVVILRLYLRTKPKSGYFVRSETRENAQPGDLLGALRDREAANVEIRQGHAASPRVTISKYYTSAGGPSGTALESPRDTLGQLWDRLEENPVTSFLMHALSRHLAWHTELFFTPDQFETFWATHAQVPLRKIQLRYIRRDGMPHSPFRDEDCVSADLFLFRYDKPAFDAYMKRTFASVRTNPGKHSN